jgi:acetolactate synthase-1/3 small subunit
MTNHTLTVLLHDGPDALHRATSLLRHGAIGLSSLTLAPSETPGVSRMTLVLDSGDATRVVKRLGALVDVLFVHDTTAEATPLSADDERAPCEQADGAAGDHLS